MSCKKSPKGPSHETVLEEAWNSLVMDVNRTRRIMEEGILFIDPKDNRAKLLEFGAVYFNQWRSGIEGYGVKYRGNDLAFIQETYESESPKNVQQISQGEWKGAFKDKQGNLIVLGIQYFPSDWDKLEVSEKIEVISKILQTSANEALQVLQQTNAFLSQHGSESLEAQNRAALSHKDWGVRKTAVSGLAMLDTNESVKAAIFISFLEDPADCVRAEAAQHLAGMNDKRAIVPFTEALKDKSGHVRLWAAIGLGEAKSQKALEALRSMAKNDPWQTVRQAALHAISRIEKFKYNTEADPTIYSVGPGYSVTTLEDPKFSDNFKVKLKELQKERMGAFSSIIQQFENLRKLQTDTIGSQSVDLVLRELRFLQKVACCELVLVTPDGNIVIMGLLRIPKMENNMKGYGLVIPDTGWESGAYLGAKGLTRQDWLLLKQSYVTSGKWVGGYKLGNEILLPGLKCFEEE